MTELSLLFNCPLSETRKVPDSRSVTFTKMEFDSIIHFSSYKKWTDYDSPKDSSLDRGDGAELLFNFYQKNNAKFIEAQIHSNQ